MRPMGHRNAFTLNELLVSSAVLGVLMALFLSGITSLREAASQIQCQNHLRQLALAVHSYHHSRGALPPYVNGANDQVHGGWFVHLLPFVDLGNLHDEIASRDAASADQGLFAPAIWDPNISRRTFPLLICHSDPLPEASERTGRTNYLANWYAFTDRTAGAYSAPLSFQKMPDGLSSVVLFAEGYATCGGYFRHALNPSTHHNFGITPEGKASDDPAYAPEDYTMFQTRPESCHGWRTQTPHLLMPAAYADGSARHISAAMTPQLWKALLKPDDGQSD